MRTTYNIGMSHKGNNMEEDENIHRLKTYNIYTELPKSRKGYYYLNGHTARMIISDNGNRKNKYSMIFLRNGSIEKVKFTKFPILIPDYNLLVKISYEGILKIYHVPDQSFNELNERVFLT